ncbi:hypothetical protein UPYG_G00234620 [Umbra pygmaea]|uniref:Uncharacterized protein n=1 Tax=Umbra pygmaea TaxID=75934 RepID=A0ABD0WEY7_UMBPY
MAKLESFREYLNERLTAAAMEIFGAVEKTVAEYQEENDRLGELLRSTPSIQQCKIESYMEATVLRVILGENIQKLRLPSGIPVTMQDLIFSVKETFEITEEFSLQYMDTEFGDYFTLSSTADIQNKDTIKVVYTSSTILTVCPDKNIDNVAIDSCSTATTYQSEDSAGYSASCDMLIVSPKSFPERVQWPEQFEIPCFSHESEIVLARANEAYRKEGTLLTNPRIKSDILERLAECIYMYTAYPTSLQIISVAKALIQTHPCLKEPGSVSGHYTWQTSIKYKMGNYRTKLRGFGVPEVECNMLKHKHPDDKKPAKNVKKARRAEVNYLPLYPVGENAESLEKERIQLVTDAKKKDNTRMIQEKMTKTFSHRRHEVVNQCPSVKDLKDRWPALFETTQIKQEFQRITTKQLEPKFLSMLDQYTPKLLSIYHSKGGALGNRLRDRMAILLQNRNSNPTDKTREVVIRCLIDYLGEEEGDLIKEYHDVELGYVLQDLGQHVMKIYVIKNKGAMDNDCTEEIGIVLEGVQVITGLGNMAQACALLLGMTYALNLSYPKQMKYTFEAFQKLLVELDCTKLTIKMAALKNKLLS